MVPSAGNRRALLERGDADISYELPNKDFVELKNAGKLSIVSTPFSNGIQYIGMNVTKPPFDNLKVRQAVAYAIPYQKIMDAVLFGLGEADVRRARRQGHRGRLAAAAQVQHRHRQGQAAAGRSRLSRTASRPRSRSISASPPSTSRSACWCRRASAQIGIKATINKIPGANWRTELNKKVMPLYTNVFSGWLDYPEYFFIWCYHGKNSIFNTMSYQSKDDGRLHRRRGRPRRRTATRRATTRT